MKPWDITDDDVANGMVPARTEDVDEADDIGAAGLDDEVEEFDDPWSDGDRSADVKTAEVSPASRPAVPAARRVGPRAGEDASQVSAPVATAAVRPEPEPPVEQPVVQAAEEPGEESSPVAAGDVVDDGPAAAEPSTPQPAVGAPVEAAGGPDDFDDDFWDAPVVPDADGPADSGYDLGPAPQPVVVPGPAVTAAPEAAVEDGEDPDDSLTVVLRRNREPQEVPPARTYRTSEQARRPARPSERRHRMDTAPVKPSPLARVKKLFGGAADDSAVHESSARRATIRPLNVVVMGKKGGVGKTAVAALLGMVFASVRNDRVLAVDASPTGGNLSARCPKEGKGTVVSLLDQLEHVTSYANVREHTSKGSTGLEVLGADVHRPQRPIDGADYRRLMDELRRHYQLILSDTPGDITTAPSDGSNGMLDALLDEADLLVLVAEGVDGANAAVWLVNWLKMRLRETDNRHLERLLDDLIVVVTSRSATSNAKPEKIAKYFSEEVARRVVTVPFDRAVEGGLEIDYESISPRTRKAMLALADAVTGSDAFTGR